MAGSERLIPDIRIYSIAIHNAGETPVRAKPVDERLKKVVGRNVDNDSCEFPNIGRGGNGFRRVLRADLATD